MSFATDLTALKTAITTFVGKITTKFNDYVLKSQINAANGVCPLDASKLIPIANLPGGIQGPTGPAGPSTYDLHNFINGKPLALEVLMRAVSVRAFQIPANCAGSYAFCTTPAAAVFVISILKNNVEVGTITYSVGATSGVFSMGTALMINAGDQFAIRCKTAAQDATLSDLTIGIYGTSV